MTEQPRSEWALGWKLFALSFAALFLELMLIRWVPAVVRLVAYYANLMLISSFLGLGAGAVASTRGWKMARWFLPVLVAEVAFVLICRYVAMPGSGAEARFYQEHPQLVGYIALVGIFALNTLAFMPLGQQIGRLFNRMPPLRAYTWDLGGSLSGTMCFAAFSLFYFSPAVGIAIAMGLTVAAGLVMRRMREVVLAAIVVAAVFFSARPDAIWSPYYYILVVDQQGAPVETPPLNLRTMIDPPAYDVRVNQDFYQGHYTLNRKRYTGGVVPEDLAMAEKQYHLPYLVHPGAERVLVLGAGGGVDVEVALLNGAEHVDAVEIDPALVALSRRYNASGVYDDPRVQVHIDDGRAFLQRSKGGYDLIVFGFLDSQGLSSYGNNLRLDGYIYTVESFRQAFHSLAPDGMMSLSFSVSHRWMAVKLVEMVRQATGVSPIVYHAGTQLIILTPRGPVPEQVPHLPPFAMASFPPAEIAVATDDWPYLYLHDKAVPVDYLLVIGTLLVLSVVGVTALRGRQVGAADGHFFFLGLAFLLLQTKSIGDCALYFSATWLVTSIVIVGVLLMVLAANLIAIRLRGPSGWWYLPLLGSLLVLTLMPREIVLGWSYGQRLAWALLVVPLPIFFAGLIFSTTFREARVPSAVFGANLIGATVGGFAEYLGMAIGTHALWWLVLAAYGASFVCRFADRRLRSPAPIAEPALNLTA